MAHLTHLTRHLCQRLATAPPPPPAAAAAAYAAPQAASHGAGDLGRFFVLPTAEMNEALLSLVPMECRVRVSPAGEGQAPCSD